jgi:hypothetical protein
MVHTVILSVTIKPIMWNVVMLSVIYCECRSAIIFIIGDEEKKVL